MKSIISAIIVAGGEGKRMKTDVPKQFLELAGKPIIIHTLEKFENNPNITAIVIVCNASYLERLKGLCEEYKISKIYSIVSGGKTRQESSYRGLKACSSETGYVLIHDAVRPFLDDRMIKETLDAAITGGASTVAVEVTDTILREEDGIINEVLQREHLKKVQTPQGFRYKDILEVHEKAFREETSGFTDDCGLMVNSGFPVMLVAGAETNIKITTLNDMEFAGNRLKQNK